MSGPIVKENSNHVSVYFNSMTDFMDHSPDSSIPENNRRFLQYRDGIGYNGNIWLGPTNERNIDVINHGLLGDKELLKILQDKISQLNRETGSFRGEYPQSVKRVRRKRIYRRAGDEIDIHKVYAGKLDTAWSKVVRQEYDVKHKLVTLFIDISGIADVDVKDSLWRAVVAVKILEDLEKAGKSVKVIVGGGSNDLFTKNLKTWVGAVVVKEYNERLTLQRLAAMSHVGFFRTFGFASKMCANHQVGAGLGCSFPQIQMHQIPINLKEEIDKGHTKVIFIKKSLSLQGAKIAIEDAKRQSNQISDS